MSLIALEVRSLRMDRSGEAPSPFESTLVSAGLLRARGRVRERVHSRLARARQAGLQGAIVSVVMFRSGSRR